MGLSGIALAYSPALLALDWHGFIDAARPRRRVRRWRSASTRSSALALADRLAGAQGLLLIAVLIGVCVPVLNVGAVWPMARHGGRGLVRELVRNPLIIATVSGLVANLLGFRCRSWLEPTVSTHRRGLAGTGPDGRRRGHAVRCAWPAPRVLAVARAGDPPPAAAAGGPGLFARVAARRRVQTTVLLVFSALPTASSCYVLAARMGYDGAYVAGLVTLSTVLGMLSLPFALGVLQTL